MEYRKDKKNKNLEDWEIEDDVEDIDEEVEY